jgi:hypothetical protein
MNKNRFLTFVFSFIPGCGLMYLGYMKKGAQVMLAFTVSLFACIFFFDGSAEWMGALFFLPLPIIWFYQFFDAMHSAARMKAQGIELATDDGFYMFDHMTKFSLSGNRLLAQILAGFLILAGSVSLISGLLNYLRRFPRINQELLEAVNIALRYHLIPALVSVALIATGIWLLRGGKAKKQGETTVKGLDDMDGPVDGKKGGLR